MGNPVAIAKCAKPFLKGNNFPSKLLVPSGQIQILRLFFLTKEDKLFIEEIAFSRLLLSINKWPESQYTNPKKGILIISFFSNGTLS